MRNFLFILMAFIVVAVSAQDKALEKDLKVGLVLSGGGAKGFAHIAAIKVLEEAGVRVDFIGGTSMGAIVGALYASGYNATELDSILKNVDFENIMMDDLPRSSQSFYEKKEGKKYAIKLPVKNKKVGLPVAISTGQNVLNLFMKLTQHVHDVRDFNKLPIPFLCVATNLETGRKVVLKKGSLAKAIRASGAFPTLLAPVEIEGQLLVDGGIVDNFPVDEVKKMGADIVIGVDVQDGLDEKKDLDSAVKIISQIVGFQMYGEGKQVFYENLDVHIRPDMTNYDVVSFDKREEILEKGDIAARIHMERLKEIASHQHRENLFVEKTDYEEVFEVKNITIHGAKNYTTRYVKGKLNINKKDSINYHDLLTGINNLSATKNFKGIDYFVLNSGEERSKNLTFNLEESELETSINLGVHYDKLYKTSVLLNVTTQNVLVKNDLMSFDFMLGDNIRYKYNYFIDNGFHWSFGFRSELNGFRTNMKYRNDYVQRINLVYEDWTNQLYLQTVLNRNLAFGIGGELKRIRAYTETLIKPGANSNKSYFDDNFYVNAYSYISYDTYDREYFVKNGWQFDARFVWHTYSTGHTSDFNLYENEASDTFIPTSKIYGKWAYTHTFNEKFTLQISTGGGVSLGADTRQPLNFFLGGYGDNYLSQFTPFYGYEIGELSANSYLVSTAKIQVEIFKDHYVSFAKNIANINHDLYKGTEVFKVTNDGYALGYGLNSFLGPIEFHYSWSPDHNDAIYYVNLGFWF
ncbi:MAG: patatin-like phospholipase family protein [Flavobacteriaceae bacterium]|nr:patatin-like phospholipase family protein [Flavobacteriaceae bacterium]